MNTPLKHTHPNWRELPASRPLLRPSEVMQQTGLSRSTMFDLIARGEFPGFIKIGRRASAMPAAWLEAFIAERGRLAVEDAEFDNG